MHQHQQLRLRIADDCGRAKRRGRRGRERRASAATVTLLLSICVLSIAPVGTADAATSARTTAASGGGAAERARPSQGGESSLESAAAKAGNTGRAVAMSLIGLAFAVAATVLAFRRDFKEAAGVFAVGIVSVLLATPAGVNLLRDTVSSLFGSQ
jgi:hypothetical protein